MQQKVAIITGIRGMDAEALTDILLGKGYIVVGTYRKASNFDESQVLTSHGNNSNLYLEHCDITDKLSIQTLISNVLTKYGRLDELYLLAAQSHVGHSFQMPDSTVLTNGMSVFYFLETLQLLAPQAKTYFAATSELMGGDPTKVPFNEKSEFECRSPYSIGKELGVRWIKYFQMTYGMFCTYGVLFNHSSTSRDKSFFIRKLTHSAARVCAGKQKDVYFGNLNFYRDEHWSDFGCEMMWKMLQRDKPETYLICRGECFHGEQFLDEAFGYFNLRWQDYVKFDKSLLRANEVVKLVGDPSKAIQELGWRPNRMSFKQHISLMCKHDYDLETGNLPERPKVFDLFP